jgi:hypothetical protein
VSPWLPSPAERSCRYRSASDTVAADEVHWVKIALSSSVGTRLVACALLLTTCGGAHAGGGPLGIDYELRYDDAGIWKRSYQLDLEYAVLGTTGVGALMLGNDNPLGHAFWQDIDAEAISSIAAEGLKYAFSRARPYQGDNPNLWFQGRGEQSFPSGEVTLQAAFVTPIIFDYVRRDPWIVALEILPIYDAVGRMKVHAHWQSDTIAGWMLGTGIGYWTSTFKVPLLVRLLPGGVSIGLSKRF